MTVLFHTCDSPYLYRIEPQSDRECWASWWPLSDRWLESGSHSIYCQQQICDPGQNGIQFSISWWYWRNSILLLQYLGILCTVSIKHSIQSMWFHWKYGLQTFFLSAARLHAVPLASEMCNRVQDWSEQDRREKKGTVCSLVCNRWKKYLCQSKYDQLNLI